MANNCQTTIIFSGDKQTLENINNAIITKNYHKHSTVSFALVEPLVPSIRDSELFKMIGCDYYDFLTTKDTNKKQQMLDKVSNFLDKNNWIGLRDTYINNVWNTEIKNEDGKLVLNLEMPWYCPTQFFIRVAEQFKVNLVLIEKVEGNFTHMTYKENDQYVTTLTNLKDSLNPDFIKHAIDSNYLQPAEFLLAAIYNRNDSLAREILKEYDVSQFDLTTCVDSLINNEDIVIFQSSLFSGKLCDDEDFAQKLDMIKQEALNFIDSQTQKATTTNSLRFKF